MHHRFLPCSILCKMHPHLARFLIEDAMGMLTCPQLLLVNSQTFSFSRSKKFPLLLFLKKKNASFLLYRVICSSQAKVQVLVKFNSISYVLIMSCTNIQLRRRFVRHLNKRVIKGDVPFYAESREKLNNDTPIVTK